MPLPSDLADCLVLNTVASSRSLLKRWDAKLKPYGVTVQQFFLLAAIRFLPEQPVMTLAESIALDRTSLTRNLDLLEKKGLVQRIPGLARSRRVCELTSAGGLLLNQLLAAWPEARMSSLEGISEEEAEIYLRVVRRLATQ
ncbi:MarR family transcriptional regulator [Aurantimonas aggregata]|uniref:MarR family transcriptional regulator n=1 Tax=Aurantimonas aggregata TaxID=2047720 RepID=A0A6L9MMA1_9HYPH|nr:MarR family transcriptional regulator [Aurantimonas aggregata]NDV88967.1 MarR family transcriptional regulator [Aurantimonas aggregata]